MTRGSFPGRDRFAGHAAVLVGVVVLACSTPSASGSPGATAGAATSGGSATPIALPAPTTGPCGGRTARALPWWNDRVFYEVFVRSFQDSDGDGVGDLRGLIDRLDYLNDGDPSTTDDLGVTGIWLMPVAESPSYHGYDVVDYTAVEEDYGTTADFRALVTEAHERGIAVIIDLVLNHTSREHPWFVDARIPGSEHDDWYLWATEEPRVTKPGGGRVWHRAGSRFYYSYFWEGMGDLNLANPDVTAALDDVGRYWIDEMGVDGYRLDAIKHLFESGPALEELPETHTWLRRYQDRLEALDPDTLLVGEVYSDTSFSAAYVPESVDLTFDFGFAQAVVGGLSGGGARDAARALQESLDAYPPGQRAVFLTNHDQTRVATKLRGNAEAGKAAAVALLTSPGVPFLYYGEELGLVGDKPDERIRTPMPWEPTTPGLGFTTGTPWQEPQEGSDSANVETQTRDPDSLLSAYRDVIRLRAEHRALSGAEAVVLETSERRVLATLRHAEDETIIVVTNFSGRDVEAPEIDLGSAPCVTVGAPVEVLYGDADAQPVADAGAWRPVDELGPYQSVILRIGGAQ